LLNTGRKLNIAEKLGLVKKKRKEEKEKGETEGKRKIYIAEIKTNLVRQTSPVTLNLN
jgi:hypothetical protein